MFLPQQQKLSSVHYCSIFVLTALALSGTACSADPVAGGGGGGGLDAGVNFDVKAMDSGKKVDVKNGLSDTELDVVVPPGPDANAGEYGATCTQNLDCDSGYCINGPNGKVCTKKCIETCDPGWICGQIAGSGDTQFVCLPSLTHICDPCAKGADCNENGSIDNLCIAQGPLGSFCGTSCNPAKPNCPNDYECVSAINPDNGKAAYQCAPVSGQCKCSPAAVSKGLSTACSQKNMTGTCNGLRKCGATGLSECDAAVPALEVCNGKDDDCNGLTDEGVGKGEVCYNKNEFGTCAGVSSGCDSGEPTCDAKTAKPETCNGIDDDCNGKTDDNLCEDGNPCTIGTCNTDGSCKQVTPPDGSCDDGNACTQLDKCIDGKCIGADVMTCDDKNPCTTDSCDIAKGCVHVSKDNAPCTDDGNACTTDVCQVGKCAHIFEAGKPCPDDGDSCTSDLCDAVGTCKHSLDSGICSIGGVCVQAGAIDPSDPCKVCNPVQSKSTFVSQNGLVCDDGDACTVLDKCNFGACKGKAMDCSANNSVCGIGICVNGQCSAKAKDMGLCDDGDACTSNDSCVAGFCKGTPKDCTYLDGKCNSGSCQNGQCQSQAKVGACDDGDPCTVGDSCAGGACKGTQKDCSGLNSVCGGGICQGGQCVATPINNGGGCNDGNGCTDNDHCQNGQCSGSLKDCSALNDACGIAVCNNGQCIKGASGPCAPGQVQNDSQSCGNCGTQSRSRSCNNSCQWGAWSAFGSCGGQGTCAPGKTESQSQACGNCGSQSHTRTCNNSCQWGAYGAYGSCGSQGVCSPGATDGNCADGCQQRVCNASCSWGGCGLKPGNACVYNAGKNYQCCGSLKWQFCSASCQWFPCQYSASSGCN